MEVKRRNDGGGNGFGVGMDVERELIEEGDNVAKLKLMVVQILLKTEILSL